MSPSAYRVRAPALRAAACAAFAACLAFAPPARGVTLEPPRFVLNRSVFLRWDAYTGAGFTRYEVHSATASGFTPAPATLRVQLTDASRTYADVRSLAAATNHHFIVRTVTTGGNIDSAPVSALTAPDSAASQIRILMYHHVQPRAEFPAGYDDGGWVSTTQFAEQLAYVRAHNMHAITHREYWDWKNGGIPLPPNPVLLTFDDGYKDFLIHALPQLVAYDCIGVNYIVTQMTGQYNTWAPEWPQLPLMTWSEIRTCRKNGIWLGSHTQTHANLHYDKTRLYEIPGSRNDLQAQLGEHAAFFCYPWGFGYSDTDVLAELTAAGYTAAVRTFNSFDEPADANDHRYQLPRIFTYASDSLYDFVARLNIDTDGDGLKNHFEMAQGLNDALPDSDGDGLDDYAEVAYDGNAGAYNPYDPATNPSGTDLNANKADTDGDGLDDAAELHTHGTNPLRADTDGDGLSDGAELDVHGTLPLVADTDGDGLSDGAEVNTHGTSPLLRDSDGDLVEDGDELAAGTDPADPASFPTFVAGEVLYGGGQTGTVYVQALPGAGAGRALRLAGGSGDYVNVPSSASLSFGDRVTIEAWIRPDTLGNDAVLLKGQAGATWDYGLMISGARFGYAQRNGDYGVLSSVLTTGAWQHVAVTADDATHQIRFYRNGERLTNVGALAGTPDLNNLVQASGYALQLGPRGFDGLIDDVRVWRAARTQAEIQADMNRTLTGTEPGLAAWWHFDDGTAGDGGTNGNNGAFAGTADTEEHITALAEYGRNGPGAYSLAGLPTGTSYWLRAFLDTDGDHAPDPGEPYGEFAGNALALTSAVANADIAIAGPDSDGDGLEDYDETQIYGTQPGLQDTDVDGMPDGWEVWNLFLPLVPDGTADADTDTFCNVAEYIAGTDPTNPASFWQTRLTNHGTGASVWWPTRANRLYGLEHGTGTAPDAMAWHAPAGWTNVQGDGADWTWPVTNAPGPHGWYRVTVRMAP